MTGNKNAWRAPLAGLASVAMIATMGVAASTASAADANKVTVESTAAASYGVALYDTKTGKVLVQNDAASFAQGETLGKNYKVVDTKTDGKTATKFALYAGTNTSDPVWADGIAGKKPVFTTAAITPSGDFQLGLASTDLATANQVTFKDFDGTVEPADISADGLVIVPDTEDYYTLAGKLVKGGTIVSVDDENQTAEAYRAPVVTFVNAKGKVVAAKKTDKGFLKGEVPALTNPRAEGWFLAGTEAANIKNLSKLVADKVLIKDTVDGVEGYWLDVDYIGSVEFAGSVTFEAVNNDKIGKVKVVFDYGSYKGAPKDVKATVKANERIDVNSVIAEKPSRDGYKFLGWTVEGTSDHYNALLTYAGDLKDANSDDVVTLTADWHKPGKGDAEAALREHPAFDTPEFKKVDAFAEQFTKASYEKYAAAWKDAYDQYKQAKWSYTNGSVNEETAAKIISTLRDGANQLRYNTGSVDTTLDGKSDETAATVLVYRLSTPDGSRHFMTADENEVLARTNTNNGQGGWKLESAATFRAINGKFENSVLDEGDDTTPGLGYDVDGADDESSTVFTGLIKKVYRLYNPILQEHLYTSDTNEVRELTTNYGWSMDSSEANLYTPSYETTTPVVRFYNKATGLHFYTADKNEIQHWTGTGVWDNEGNKFYAL